MDSYLSAAEQLQKSDSEFQIDLYTKMGVRNNQIEESANNDEEATQEFMKVLFWKQNSLDRNTKHLNTGFIWILY